MNLSAEKKLMDLENRFVVPKGEGDGVGWIGSLGLLDANCCSWNGFTIRSCCVALRTMSRYLHCNTTMGGKSMYTYMCNLVPMLYSGKKIFNFSIDDHIGHLQLFTVINNEIINIHLFTASLDAYADFLFTIYP